MHTGEVKRCPPCESGNWHHACWQVGCECDLGCPGDQSHPAVTILDEIAEYQREKKQRERNTLLHGNG